MGNKIYSTVIKSQSETQIIGHFNQDEVFATRRLFLWNLERDVIVVVFLLDVFCLFEAIAREFDVVYTSVAILWSEWQSLADLTVELLWYYYSPLKELALEPVHGMDIHHCHPINCMSTHCEPTDGMDTHRDLHVAKRIVIKVTLEYSPWSKIIHLGPADRMLIPLGNLVHLVVKAFTVIQMKMWVIIINQLMPTAFTVIQLTA